MRIKHYLDINVLESAKQRLRKIYDIFDSVVVCCSFGKDSVTTLGLCREICEERGVSKVKCLFRDEELIPDSVIDFGLKIRELNWVDLKWFCVPLRSTKFILGKTYPYIQWDNDRKWMRDKPDFSIKSDKVYDQYTIDNYAASFYRGSVCFVTGIRADESLMRLRSVMNKPHEPYITAPDGAPRVRLAKPIYDWQENDVFKYLVESGLNYATWYDKQMWSSMQLRVSTPLHAEQSKRLYKLRELDPSYYDRLLRIFPEIQDQDRYWRDFDQEAFRARYASVEAIRSYIDEHIEDEGLHRKAVKMLEHCEVLHKKNPDAYPVKHLLNHFMCGRYKRMPLPINKEK